MKGRFDRHFDSYVANVEAIQKAHCFAKAAVFPCSREELFETFV